MRNLAIGLLILSCNSAAAEEAALAGVGVNTCGQFAEHYKSAPVIMETSYFVWAQGFMSGINSSRLLEKRPTYDLRRMSADEQKFHIRHYCNEHPLALYVQAVLTLLTTFPQSAPPQSK